MTDGTRAGYRLDNFSFIFVVVFFFRIFVILSSLKHCIGSWNLNPALTN